MREEDAHKLVSDWQKHLGRRGGVKRTPAQLEARRRNAAKARETRARKRLEGNRWESHPKPSE